MWCVHSITYNWCYMNMYLCMHCISRVCTTNNSAFFIGYCHLFSISWIKQHLTDITHYTTWSCELTCKSSSRMRVMNHNWSATKQRLHLQGVAEISRHSVLSEDRIRQCVTLCAARTQISVCKSPFPSAGTAVSPRLTRKWCSQTRKMWYRTKLKK